jgi:hypothetical protein
MYEPPASDPTLPDAPQAKRLGDDLGMRMLLPVGRSGWAIAAGYLGLFALVVIPAPLALIFGIIGWWDIHRSKSTPRPKHGMGRVIFALITGGLGTAIIAYFLLKSLTR